MNPKGIVAISVSTSQSEVNLHKLFVSSPTLTHHWPIASCFQCADLQGTESSKESKMEKASLVLLMLHHPEVAINCSREEEGFVDSY